MNLSQISFAKNSIKLKKEECNGNGGARTALDNHILPRKGPIKIKQSNDAMKYSNGFSVTSTSFNG